MKKMYVALASKGTWESHKGKPYTLSLRLHTNVMGLCVITYLACIMSLHLNGFRAHRLVLFLLYFGEVLVCVPIFG